MAKGKIRKRPMSEINVVPYIDVMLVLLVIFMITTPLLTQGVKVDLPQASAKPIPPSEIKPVVLTVDANGQYTLNVGENQSQPLDEATIMARVAAVLRHRQGTPILVKGDKGVPYGKVMDGMVLLQAAGAPSIGLITEPPDNKR
jgi:biopolymer transport protein TolR